MAVTTYLFTFIPNEIALQWIRYLTTKDCIFFGSTCKRYLILTKEFGYLKTPFNLLGFSNDWPRTKQFKEIRCTNLNHFKLWFECTNFNKLRKFLYIYYQVVLNSMTKGVHATLTVTGHGREKAHYWAKNHNSRYNWSFQFEWDSLWPATVHVHLIGVVRKACHAPPHFYISKHTLATPQQNLMKEYTNLPHEEIKKIEDTMRDLFTLAHQQ